MEDIKLWELDGTQATPLDLNNQLESEQGLEDTLVKNPNLLLDGLTLVGRQTPTEGGPLDLLGVDGDGKLVVFELKRGTLSRDAVAQIIDYASDLDAMDLGALAEHISERSGVRGIDKIEDFHDWYSQNFGELESLMPLRMFLVGLGADETTERMVRFLAENSGMDISLLTFHAFDYDGRTILAKQVEVEANEGLDFRLVKREVGREELQSLLEERVSVLGVTGVFDDVCRMFRMQHENVLPDGYLLEESPGKERISFSLYERTPSGNWSSRAYFAVSLHKSDTKRVRVNFYPRAIELCEREFERLTQNGSFKRTETPYGAPTERIKWGVHLPLNSLEDWEASKEEVSGITKSVYEAWLRRKQEEDSN